MSMKTPSGLTIRSAFAARNGGREHLSFIFSGHFVTTVVIGYGYLPAAKPQYLEHTLVRTET